MFQTPQVQILIEYEVPNHTSGDVDSIHLYVENPKTQPPFLSQSTPATTLPNAITVEETGISDAEGETSNMDTSQCLNVFKTSHKKVK